MSFKSLNDSTTWGSTATETKETDNTEQENSRMVVTAVDVLSMPTVTENTDSDYDIPNSKESLQKLVINLKAIVSKLSEQIQMMSDKE